MLSLDFETIFTRFLGKVTDYDLANFDKNIANEIMSEYLYSAISLPEVNKLFTNLEVDENIQKLTFELKNSTNNDSGDIRFTTEIILIAMQIAWLEPMVNSQKVTLQMFGGKEEKFYAQSNQLSALTSLLEQNQIRLKKRIRDHNFYTILISKL